jgi:hypothetical protein
MPTMAILPEYSALSVVLDMMNDFERKFWSREICPLSHHVREVKVLLFLAPFLANIQGLTLHLFKPVWYFFLHLIPIQHCGNAPLRRRMLCVTQGCFSCLA